MWKYKLLLGCLVFWLLAGCRSDDLSTPTPFPPTPENINVKGASMTPVPAMLVDVVANPEFYEGAYLQVTGQYFKRPLQVCGLDPHPSPAGWELAAGDVRVPAGGADKQMRQLLPEGLSLTVIGRWTHWQGPVGCGKQAVAREIWYLDVVKLVEPAQLALVTLTPSGSGDAISDGGIGLEMFTPVSGSGLEVPGENGLPMTLPPVAPPINTLIPTQAIPVETLAAGFTPVATSDIVIPLPDVKETPIAGETAVNTTPPVNGTSTIISTPPPGSTSTPVALGTSSGVLTIMNGDIGDPDYFKVDELAASETHEWTMPLEANDEIILSVIGEPSMDVMLTIHDANGNELAKANQNAAGKAENLTFLAPADANYKVRISEVNRQAGGYLVARGEVDYQLLSQGMLSYGATVKSTIFVDEIHYWFFKGSQGDRVTLTVPFTPNTNLLTFLYDGDGKIMAVDEIENIALPATGWYVLELEEWLADKNEYQLTLTK